jgi:hypothetical protein
MTYECPFGEPDCTDRSHQEIARIREADGAVAYVLERTDRGEMLVAYSEKV